MSLRPDSTILVAGDNNGSNNCSRSRIVNARTDPEVSILGLLNRWPRVSIPFELLATAHKFRRLLGKLNYLAS